MSANVQIETERLRFRECTLDDLDDLLVLFSDEETMHRYRGTRTPDEVVHWLTTTVGTWERCGYGYWMLDLKETGDLVGFAGLYDYVVDDVEEVEAGYVINHEYWGIGLGGEAAAACYEFADARIEIDRVITLIDPRNTACIALAQRHGLAFERQTAMWGRTVHVYANPPW